MMTSFQREREVGRQKVFSMLQTLKNLSNACLTFQGIKEVLKLWSNNCDFEGHEKYENEAISREKKFSGCWDPSQKLRRQILLQKSPGRRKSIRKLKLL